MKRIIPVPFLVALLVQLCQICTAQQIVIAPLAIDDNGYEYSKVLGHDESGFYILQSNISFASNASHVGFRMRKYNLLYCDMNLNIKWQKELSNDIGKKKLAEIFYFNSKPLLIYAEQIDNKNYKIFFEAVSAHSEFTFFESQQFAIKLKSNEPFELINGTPSFYHEKFCLLLPEHFNDSIVFNFAILDTSLAHISQKRITIPTGDTHFAPDEFDVSDWGDVAISGVYSPDKKIRNNKVPENISYQTYMSVNKTADAVVYDFKVPGKSISEASIAFDNDAQQLAVAGFFETESQSDTFGIAYTRYNCDAPGPAAIKLCYLHNRLPTERTAGDVANFAINKLLLRSDSGIIVLSEDFYKEEYSFYDYFTQTIQQRFEYHYDNLMIASIDSKGKAEWVRNVRKQQTSTNDDAQFLSYVAGSTNGKLYMFYNRDISINNEVIGVNIDKQGLQADNDLLRATDHTLIYPKYGKQVADNIIVVPVLQKKKMRLAKIIFN